MDKKSVLLQQLTMLHNRDGWFVSFDHAVKGLTSEQASWKTGESTNSIWEIVNHLRFWNQRYLNSFKGIVTGKMEGDNDSTFINLDHLNWAETIASVVEIFREWHNAVKECEQEKLDSPVPHDSGTTWGQALSNLTIHTAYHIGQIVHIRKTQGSWGPELGVD
ncbi:DinB family protein [Peribacillus glennii]|uniref:DinB family protein n=2 Tax=Peribacillus glennii TaxID=2303991 RepID=A0A372L8E6_9BACI|nr:DinB family protein [Peribacillus glennii]